jgi:ComF family protein
LKYRGDMTLGEILARPLIELLEKNNWDPDAVIPVPISEQRLFERGYNQSALLARPVALAIGKTYQSKGLVKSKDTDTQVGLTYAQRMENVYGAFLADRNYVNNQRILLIDDVTTSGATMEACSAALKKAGALEVFGLTLARSRYFSAG